MVATQVQLYFPELDHPAYGIVRAIVKDASDIYRGLPSTTFLDSDGKVQSLLCAAAGDIACLTQIFGHRLGSQLAAGSDTSLFIAALLNYRLHKCVAVGVQPGAQRQ
jgi:hypothetical protein